MHLNRLPLRTRLIAGFVAAMLVVLIAAGAFVFWRVQFALDHRLDEDLRSQTGNLRRAATRLPPASALRSVGDQARDAQLLRADGTVLASGPGIAAGRPLISAEQSRLASRRALRTGRGDLFSRRGHHRRILALPVHAPGPAAVAVTAVRLDQRDEALRELLAQLTIANLLALTLASVVGYGLARRALEPVERYRAKAEQIAEGAEGVRLDVPEAPVDEITRLGATLNAMLDAQELAAARQQEFIDDASHELRTPLSALSAEIELALRKPRAPEEHEATLRRLARYTTHLVELAETLLTLGRLGSAAPDAADVPAQDVLTAAARRAHEQLEVDSAREIRVDSAPGLVLHADPVLLGRAVGNLVDNAVRHGGGTITLTAARLRGVPAPAAVVTVHDEGEGLAPAFLPHAAERFTQDESSRAGAGAGLGLSLVDAIMSAHHGQLRICSAGRHHCREAGSPALVALPCAHPDAGTTVSLLLPPAARAAH